MARCALGNLHVNEPVAHSSPSAGNREVAGQCHRSAEMALRAVGMTANSKSAGIQKHLNLVTGDSRDCGLDGDDTVSFGSVNGNGDGFVARTRLRLSWWPESPIDHQAHLAQFLLWVQIEGVFLHVGLVFVV